MKKPSISYLFLLAFVMVSLGLQAQFNCSHYEQARNFKKSSTGTNIDHNPRSDTFDIEAFNIWLDFTALPYQNLEAKATVVFTPQFSGLTELPLDLQQLTVDSVLHGSTWVTFAQANDLVKVNLNAATSAQSVDSVTVYYSGQPPEDPTGWGGVHFDSPYFYNLGVGFGENPHVYGRAWFPCFDNFVEKSTFDIHITVTGGRTAFANGVRMGITTEGANTTYHWRMTDPIPSYLASFAISNYTELNYTHTGAFGTHPISLAARPQDTNNVKASFVHLPGMIDSYENAFGPYVWQKVGYAMTITGAMEHATSIHLPISLANGTLAGEEIIAHELAHHWWGDLITCKTAEDMWINEGMAEFASHFYHEAVYSRNRYEETVQNNADLVLKVAHLQDGEYLAIAGVPHSLTYGTHVYQKGAMVGHNLRGYMGDTAFYAACATVMNQRAFGNLSTDEFRIALENASGQNLVPFFDAWVTAKGFPQFSIDSMKVTPGAVHYQVDLALHQRLHQAPALYTQVPLEVLLVDAQGNSEIHKVQYGTQDAVVTIISALDPKFAVLHPRVKILTATTQHLGYFDPGNTNLPRSRGEMTYSGSDSVWAYVAHHLVSPEGKNALGYKLSDRRYWTVYHDADPTEMSLEFSYNGDKNQGGIDTTLLEFTEDSLRLLYRPDASYHWNEYPHYVKNGGFPTDQKGNMELTQVLPGEYVLANGAEGLSIDPNHKPKMEVQLYPNPSDGKFELHYVAEDHDSIIEAVYSSSGQLVHQRIVKVSPGENTTYVDLTGQPKGSYLLHWAGQVFTLVIGE